MQSVPLSPLASQQIGVALGGQSCTIRVYQKTTGLFLDLYVDSNLIVGGVICKNRTLLVRTPYLGFQGDLGFYDSQGSFDPVYSGLGARFQLIYLSASEIVE